MTRIRLTKSILDQLQAPAKGQAFIWDSEIPGFAVRITPTGIKAWIVQMRVRGGKERRMTVVRGEQREDSDVDVLVELGDDMDLIAYAGLQLELSDALGVAVDLVEWEALRPRLAPHVLSEVVPL